MIKPLENTIKAREEIVKTKSSLALKLLCRLNNGTENFMKYSGGVILHSGSQIMVVGSFDDELVSYIKMQPQPVNLFCEHDLGQALFKKLGGRFFTGSIMKYHGTEPSRGEKSFSNIYDFSHIEVAKLIKSCDSATRDFDEFYTGLSHSLRKSYTFAYIRSVEGEIISCALVELCDYGKVITGVSTKMEHRRRGYAGDLIKNILADFSDEQIILLSKDAGTDSFYSKLGFTVVERYMEIEVGK